MKRRNNKFNKIIFNSWFTSIFFLILGIFLFVKPKMANSLIGYLVGAIVLASGVSSIVNYVISKKDFKYMNFQLIYGIITSLLGIFVIFNPLSISGMLMIGVGIWMIVSGAMKINTALFLKRQKEEVWPILIFIGFLILLSGVLLIFNPFKGTMVVTQVLGVFVIVYAILDTMQLLLMKKRSKDIIEFIK